MAEQTVLDRTFQVILQRFVATGQAPHYAEIAEELGVSPEEGRQALRKLFKPMSFPGWLHPNTDHIATFPPFSNLPNQHRITIGGEQKWFGQ